MQLGIERSPLRFLRPPNNLHRWPIEHPHRGIDKNLADRAHKAAAIALRALKGLPRKSIPSASRGTIII
jgi:hypothetical protein